MRKQTQAMGDSGPLLYFCQQQAYVYGQTLARSWPTRWSSLPPLHSHLAALSPFSTWPCETGRMEPLCDKSLLHHNAWFCELSLRGRRSRPWQSRTSEELRLLRFALYHTVHGFTRNDIQRYNGVHKFKCYKVLLSYHRCHPDRNPGESGWSGGTCLEQISRLHCIPLEMALSER